MALVVWQLPIICLALLYLNNSTKSNKYQNGLGCQTLLETDF